MKKKAESAAIRSGQRQTIFEELEGRLLLSADIPGLLADTALLEGAGEQPAAQVDVQHAESDADARVLRELVFVDAGVEDAAALVEDLHAANSTGADGREFEIVLLDSGRDGIGQITDVLDDYSGLDAIHIVSHGSEGQAQLGSTALSSGTLASYESALTSWGDALSADADLLFYGCDLAGGAEGQGFVDSLGKLTGADVAASTDLTGSSLLGGDWDLEYETGSIETQIALSAGVQEGYGSVLESAITSEAVYFSTPLTFEQNNGQTDQQVDFFARGSGYTVFLTEGDAVLMLQEGDAGHVVRLDLLGGDTTAACLRCGFARQSEQLPDRQ